jgi:hypothetical protein
LKVVAPGAAQVEARFIVNPRRVHARPAIGGRGKTVLLQGVNLTVGSQPALEFTPG